MLLRTLTDEHVHTFRSMESMSLCGELGEWTKHNYEAESTAPGREPRSLRLLALHGYGQNGEIFAAKIRRFAETLNEQLATRAPGGFDGVEVYCPPGPYQLDTHARAWTPYFDYNSYLEEDSPTTELLAKYVIENGPFDAVVGFSQGAGTAMALASWCEAGVDPVRKSALASQACPFRRPPPQGPFRFAILASGGRRNAQSHCGFFEPTVNVPVLHFVAELDQLNEPEFTNNFNNSWTTLEVVRHYGTHFWPTNRRRTGSMVEFACRSLGRSEKYGTLGSIIMPSLCLLDSSNQSDQSRTHTSSNSTPDTSPSSSSSSASSSSRQQRHKPRFRKARVVKVF
ncbi:hypothetical protein BAUCODRAFT_499598 [Baudoinia panamericana UAMH 10762]|uniref:Serine hydrolase domain-containing protein n=1 Tax=Baudoinia panamericana (strain UAMH 10762) TaxID=717646 RepID=M2MVX6_BAUPA|nr:uncharacterized protein BAUCODRAFT_499598 [Baudoinia panamericana UAMH 10762]EMC95708.1 hypothetical protein BAUCODRAFT_499598 [Baudoinia panamericana UAMH 10762]